MNFFLRMVTVALCLFIWCPGAQAQRQQFPKNQIAVSIFIKDKNKNPQGGISITLEGQKDHSKYKFKTNDRGLAEAVLPRGQDYAVHLKNAVGFDTIIAQYTSSQIFNFFIEYDKNSDAHPAMNPLACQNLQPDSDHILLDIVTTDFDHDSLELMEVKSGVKKIIYTDKEHCQKVRIKKGTLYTILWRGFYINDSIYYAPSRSVQSMEIRLVRTYSKIKRLNPPPGYVPAPIDFYSGAHRNDSVFQKVMNRNHWDSALVVMDVTGSMSPYIYEVGKWYVEFRKKNKDRVQFTFFNDGNNKSDAEKVIGNTGGIYYSRSYNTDSILALMNLARSNGGGGDAEENDVEAILTAIKLSAPFKNLILVADNFNPVRDFELHTQIKVPVHIVLCGAEFGSTAPVFLDLAYKTKGSLHTLEGDHFNIARMKEGETIKIGRATYKLSGGKFERLEM